MNDHEEETLECFKQEMIEQTGKLYKAVLGKAMEAFEIHNKSMIDKYGSIMVTTVSEKFKEAWLYVGDNVYVQKKPIVKIEIPKTEGIVH